MKSFIGVLILIFSLCAVAMGQGTNDITFTNQVVTFTNLQGRTYRNVNLVRADDRGVVYQSGAEWGLVRYTNLSAQTIEDLGLPASKVNALANAEKERAARLAEMAEQQRERMADPANWTTVHVVAGQGTDAGWIWQVKEFSGWFFINNLPAKTVAYFRDYYALAYKINALQNQSAQLDQYIRQTDSQEAQLKAESKQEKALHNQVEATASPEAAETINTYIVDPSRKQWANQIDRRNKQLQAEMTNVSKAKAADESEIRTNQDDLQKLMSTRGETDAKISVFRTGKKLQGYPVLFAREVKDPDAQKTEQ